MQSNKSISVKSLHPNNYDEKERKYIRKRAWVVNSIVISLITFTIMSFISQFYILYFDIIVLVCHILVILAIFQANIANIERLNPVNYRDKMFIRKTQLWLLVETFIYGTGLFFFSNRLLALPNMALKDVFPLVIIIAFASIFSMIIQDKIWSRHLASIRSDLIRLISDQKSSETIEFLKKLYSFESENDNHINDSSPDIAYLFKNVLYQRYAMMGFLFLLLVSYWWFIL